MDLQKFLPNVKKNISLKNYTTFKIGGKASYFLIIEKKEDLIHALKIAKKYSLPCFILGGGSNILVSDKGLKGIVIKMKNEKYKMPNTRTSSVRGKQNTIVYAEAGVLLPVLISKACNLGLSGLEWAAGIPGTIGGATRGNAGAFGQSMGDIIDEVEAFDLKNLKIIKLTNRKCNFSYRDSIFKKKNNFIILSANFNLKKGNKKKITERVKELLNYRKEKHPQEPSAGSIFKGVRIQDLKKILFKEFPEIKGAVKEKGIPAAFLIARCGLKERKIGQAQISGKHPNFIINLGGARAKDVKKLIFLTKKRVKNKFGIILEEEIQYLQT